MPLLERDGAATAVAGALGSFVLLAGIVTRPLGGALANRWPTRRRGLVGGSLVAIAAGSLMLGAGGPLWLSALGSLVLGLGAGLPFAVVFEAAQRLRPDAPAAAIALVNGCAVLAIVVGTPLVGLGFDLPGDGLAGFAAIALLALGGLPFVVGCDPPRGPSTYLDKPDPVRTASIGPDPGRQLRREMAE